MKDNLIRIFAAILLLLCFAATVRLMGQNDSMANTHKPIFTDPHDPALGGDATLSILSGWPGYPVTNIVSPSGNAAVQTIDLRCICPVNFLAGQTEGYPFSAPCNINPAICKHSPEVLRIFEGIFAAGWQQRAGCMKPTTDTSRCDSCLED